MAMPDTIGQIEQLEEDPQRLAIERDFVRRLDTADQMAVDEDVEDRYMEDRIDEAEDRMFLNKEFGRSGSKGISWRFLIIILVVIVVIIVVVVLIVKYAKPAPAATK